MQFNLLLIITLLIILYIVSNRGKGYEEYKPKKWSSRKEWYNRSYLKSKHWRKTRNNALVKAGFRCQHCRTNQHLTVHHLTYKNLGHENPSDLLVLCWNCHKKEHRKSA